MKGQIQDALNGSQNARLRNKKETESIKNTAGADIKNVTEGAAVPIIDEAAVRHAKEWSDNGSRL